MKFCYFASSHWDREWYRPFQYFRGMLLEQAEKILDTLENDPAYERFVFDGQTVVLEDIAEIRPELMPGLKAQIAQGRLKIGPWYLMPDELLVSGEALIRNFLRGAKLAREYGAEPWGVGYVPDIFGHIAQLPQLVRGFGMETIVGWRGFDEDLPVFLRWESPDGSSCRLLRHPFRGYSDFSFIREEKDFPEAFRRMIGQQREVYGETFVLSDAFDHQDIPAEAPAVLQRIRELCPGSEVLWTDFTDLEEWKHPEELPVVRGEQIHTCKGIRAYGIQIPYTLSSRYDVKAANDLLQSRLELEMEPMAVFMGERLTANLRGLLDHAWKLCLRNQPHDSICGCSVDAVHAVMASRAAEALQICDYLRDRLVIQDRFALTGEELGGYCSAEDGRYTLRVFNPLPFVRRAVFAVPVEFMGEQYPQEFAEPRSVEKQYAFRLFDADGVEIPYTVSRIQRNVHKPEYRQFYRTFQIYTITAELELAASGWTSFRIEPSERPVRRFGSLRTGRNTAENRFLALRFQPDGTFEVRDKRSGRLYAGLNEFVFDRESGDGWGHVKPLCNMELIASSRAQVAVAEDGPLRTVFEITRSFELPEELLFTGTVNAMFGGTALSEHTRILRIVSRITFDKDSPELQVCTVLCNNIRDCRLRLCIPTGIHGEYFTSQAFVFLNRTSGRESGYATQEFRETEPVEKNFNGLAGKRDARGGIALLSRGGLHEVSGGSCGELLVTLFRAFRRTVGTEGEPDGELQRELRFDYAYRFFTEEDNPSLYRALLCLRTPPLVYTLSTGSVRSAGIPPGLELDGGLSFSALKPAENGDGTVLRLVNLSDESRGATVRLPVPLRVAECTLAECKTVQIAEKCRVFTVQLPPWKIGSWLLQPC